MADDYFQSHNMTEIFLAVYVSIGFLLLIGVSVIGAKSNHYIFRYKELALIIYIIISILAGIVSYFARRLIYNTKRSLVKDSNFITKGDVIGIIYTGFLIVLGLKSLSIVPNSNPIYSIMLIIMAISIGLNSYFGSFWRLTMLDSNKNLRLEALKLEHREWSSIYNSVIVGILVVLGGFALTFFTNSNSMIYSPNFYSDGILVAYIVFGAPILWLLRPIHFTMARIRKEIIEIHGDI